MEIIVFSAKWCAPCQALKVALKKSPLKYKIVDVDTTEGTRLADKLRVASLPALFVDTGNGPKRVLDTTIKGLYAALARYS